MIRYIAPLFLVFLAVGHAQWIEDKEIDGIIRQGIDATYNLDFEQAEKSFRAVIARRPDHPAGYFFDAMIDWWRIAVNPDDESLDERFYEKLQNVIDMADERLDRNEKDLAGLFFKGGAIGFRGRLRAMRKSWIKAAEDGKDALPVVLDAAELAPDNVDLSLGTGIYDYLAAVLPDRYPVLKPLLLLFPDGDRVRGLKELKRAAHHGRYARYEAMYMLVQAYYRFENDVPQALHYAKKLYDKFPGNSVFHRYLGRCYVRQGKWNLIHKVFTDVYRNWKKGKRGYGLHAAREAAYYIGFYHMVKRDYPAAKKYFVECDRLSRKIDKDGPSGYMVLANLKMGQVFDLMNQRKYAMKQYDKVLDMKEFRNSHELAEKYLASPYRN